jgi:diguanylate cyclase (GGDEF)-like protein
MSIESLPRNDLLPFSGRTQAPEKSGRASELVGFAIRVTLVATVYYLAARLSLHLSLVGKQVTPLWPPTGIAVVALVLLGRRIWPAIAIAAFLVNAPISSSLPEALGIAAGNTLAPLLAAGLLRRVGFRPELDRLQDALALVFLAALVSMAVSASVGTMALALSRGTAAAGFWATWSVWWSGDAMGVLVVAPFLLTLRSLRLPLSSDWRRWLEAAVLFLSIGFVTYTVFHLQLHVEYLVFPFLAWAAWRFGPPGAAPAALLSSTIAVWAAVEATGPFVNSSLAQKMVTVQVFNASAAVASFVLAAIVADRQRDIAERERAEAELAHVALHDPLTGLDNRVLFMEKLGQALARSERRPGTLAVMFLDLDRFKAINDHLGHAAGDEVLSMLGERLGPALRPGDTASRFGGDEFVIFCEEIASELEATRIANRIGDAIVQPMRLGAGEVVVTASIGIALARRPADRPETLVRDADAAVYRAKDRGGARYELFGQDMRRRIANRLRTESELGVAIEEGGLSLHYQPVLRLEDERMEAVEALVRWKHGARGLLLPVEFIPLAEQTGLIDPLGDWVLEEACRQLTVWREASPEGHAPKMMINVSPRQLARPDFVNRTRRSIAESGLEPSGLTFEITESALMEASPQTLHLLEGLRELGARVAIDDFGTGYSSLSHLRRIPLDVLKLDRSFVDGMGRNPQDAAIVVAVVDLAHALGLAVVAEGVETEQQRDQLRLLGCDYAQGFLFGRPVLPEAFLGPATTAATAGSPRMGSPDPAGSLP